MLMRPYIKKNIKISTFERKLKMLNVICTQYNKLFQILKSFNKLMMRTDLIT